MSDAKSVDTYYITAKPSAAPPYVAECTYYILGQDGQLIAVDATQPLPTSPVNAVCNFVQLPESQLKLLGVVFKTVVPPSTPPSAAPGPQLRPQNYAASVLWDDKPGTYGVTVTMPVRANPSVPVTTKGVILLFSDHGELSSLYPTDDPQVQNDGNWPP